MQEKNRTSRRNEAIPLTEGKEREVRSLAVVVHWPTTLSMTSPFPRFSLSIAAQLFTM